MHFPIIKLEPTFLDKEDWDVDLDYEDSTLNYHTDYYGEIYSDKERRGVIESAWLKDLLDGIAIVDEEKEAIQLLDAETIRKTLQDYLVQLTARHAEEAKAGKLRESDVFCDMFYYKGYWAMFYLDRGYTSYEFVEDAAYYAGNVYRIGNIFDAHI